VVLFISLIMLVAMTLAGIALIRSVDTTNLIAGNLAFKQSTLHAADQGVEQAYQVLFANGGTANLNNDNGIPGLLSARPLIEPDWSDPASWANAVTLAKDAAGNTVSYLIHRMCTESDTSYSGSKGGIANQCAISTSASSGGSSKGIAPGITVAANPMLYYRITARAAGPRNTESITQTMVLITN
jgi:Tfp pilus assembly protein PilX